MPKRTPSKPGPPGPSPAPEILQLKIWLLGISPMIWRRVQVPASLTLRELHGVIQVVMGWEGIHLFQFMLRARRFGWHRQVNELRSKRRLCIRGSEGRRNAGYLSPSHKGLRPECAMVSCIGI